MDVADGDTASETDIPLPKKYHWVVAVVMSAMMLVACGEDDTRIPLSVVEPAPGGDVATLQVVEDDGVPHLVAPTTQGLAIRAMDEGGWGLRHARWPAGDDQHGADPFEMLQRADSDVTASPEHFFTAFDERLWAVVPGSIRNGPSLMVSDDVGQTWDRVQSPTDVVAPVDERLSSILPIMRLLVVDDQLFVADAERLCGAEQIGDEPVDGRYEVDWQPVSLAGTVFDDEGDDASFFRRLHHYLPSTDVHPYELATVYGRRLKVYRRDAGDEQFEQVTSIEAVDRDVVRHPGADILYLVGSNSLYRSDDRGDSWQEIDVSRDSLDPEAYRNLQLRVGAQSDDDEFELWLFGDDGGLWRSQDGGDSWDQLRDRDPDGRAITGLVFDDRHDQLWASTGGEGVLRADADGHSWQHANAGLNAATVHAAALSRPERFVVGTDSGVYERSMLADDDWTQIGQRITTAVYAQFEPPTLVFGTSGGGVELYTDGQLRESTEVAPVGQRESVEFRPPHLVGTLPEPGAILELIRRPESTELIAWSHRRGPLISNDDGENWRRLQLDDAFRHAVDDAVISDFLSTRDQRFFAVSRPRYPDRPTQIWRSDDGGSTWQTTYAVREDPGEAPLQLAALPDGEGLLKAHGSRLEISSDGGETWSPVSGPWETGIITGLTVEGDQAVVVMDLPHASEIAWVDNPHESASIAQRHRLGWPSARPPEVHRPLDVQVQRDRVLLQEGDTVYRGEMPRRGAGGPGGVSLVIALGAVAAMITLAFGYLRRWEVGDG